MAKMLRLTDGGKVLVDSAGRAKEGKCCCPSTRECMACDAVASATTAIITISGISPPLYYGSTTCGSSGCASLDGTYFIPFQSSAAAPPFNWSCTYFSTILSQCNPAELNPKVVVIWTSTTNETDIVFSFVKPGGAGALNTTRYRSVFNGRLSCGGVYSLPWQTVLETTTAPHECIGSTATCTVTIS